MVHGDLGPSDALRKRIKHDFFVSLLGSHVSRNSNMARQISLATNFDITRVLLGFEVRGH